MHTRTIRLLRASLIAATFFAIALSLPLRVHADREHRVRPGQSLVKIAKRYKIDIVDLLAANRFNRKTKVKAGQIIRVPAPGIVYVRGGDTLSRLAKRHATTAKAIAKENKLKKDSPLKKGQRIRLPGATESDGKRKKPRWGRPKHPGVVTLVRANTHEKVRMRLMSKSGRVRKAARRRLGRLMRYRKTRKTKLPSKRLLRMLSVISDHFGGRPISIISGYRPAGGFTNESSRHTNGHALDIRIRGVKNKELFNYIKDTFDSVGVGYYPNSTFVHLDVRKKSTTWTDYSRPGEKPRYKKKKGK